MTIDPGTSTGVSLFKIATTNATLVAYGDSKVVCENKGAICNVMKNKVCEMIYIHKHDHIVIENLFFRSFKARMTRL